MDFTWYNAPSKSNYQRFFNELINMFKETIRTIWTWIWIERYFFDFSKYSFTSLTTNVRIMKSANVAIEFVVIDIPPKVKLSPFSGQYFSHFS